MVWPHVYSRTSNMIDFRKGNKTLILINRCMKLGRYTRSMLRYLEIDLSNLVTYKRNMFILEIPYNYFYG